MLGNLHVRFGVGAGGETPPAYTTWDGNVPGPPSPGALAVLGQAAEVALTLVISATRVSDTGRIHLGHLAATVVRAENVPSRDID